MGDKITINKDDIIQRVRSKYEEIRSKIENSTNPSELESEVNQFYDEIDNAIVSFFFIDNAGDGIKKIFNKLSENPTVKAMNFMFGYDQYKEYLSGMRKYIDEAKQKDLTDPEVIRAIDDVILKDDDFIKSLFVIGENKNNVENSIVLSEAVKCLDTLFSLRDTISEFKQDSFSRTILDKLSLLSKVKMLYFSVVGVFDQVDRICKELNGECETCVDEEPVYAVF